MAYEWEAEEWRNALDFDDFEHEEYQMGFRWKEWDEPGPEFGEWFARPR